MMRVVTSEFVTLDGVSEDPGGVEAFTRTEWAFGFERGPEGDRYDDPGNRSVPLRRHRGPGRVLSPRSPTVRRDRLHHARSRRCDSDLERGDLNE
jgi:hypothetical protein